MNFYRIQTLTKHWLTKRHIQVLRMIMLQSAAASRLMNKPEIKEYIEKQLAELHNEKTADAQEVLEYLTSVMRREA